MAGPEPTDWVARVAGRSSRSSAWQRLAARLEQLSKAFAAAGQGVATALQRVAAAFQRLRAGRDTGRSVVSRPVFS